MTYGHLQADCLYTGISSGPNARCRVWEAFTFTFTCSVLRSLTSETVVVDYRLLSCPLSPAKILRYTASLKC